MSTPVTEAEMSVEQRKPFDRFEARLNDMREHREMMEALVHAGVFEVDGPTTDEVQP